MSEQNYVSFTKEMKKTYTILAPNMLPIHFELILQVLRNEGYTIELLKATGPEIVETGLKYVHNDTCYPRYWSSASLSMPFRAANTIRTASR